MYAEDEVRLAPFEDDKCKSSENTGFEARSDSTPMAIPSQKSPRRVVLYEFDLHLSTIWNSAKPSLCKGHPRVTSLDLRSIHL